MKKDTVIQKVCRMLFAAGLVLVSVFAVAQQDVAAPAGELSAAEIERQSGNGWTLVIHGGAGGPARGEMSEEKEKEYSDRLEEALLVGAKILGNGGSALDAVTATVTFLEDCPLFNAGRGSVLNEAGNVEMDASVMDGQSGRAGAVGGVTTVRNPIVLARHIMENTPHVMLSGSGAEAIARKAGLKTEEPAWFITAERREAWTKWKERQRKELEKGTGRGTVGAVALDVQGNLAAATSTGGMMGKMPGRLGDSPVIGAGTYASNGTCAVSCTGHGELFIRGVVAFRLSAMMEYGGASLAEAADRILAEQIEKHKATGGLIAVDRTGNIAMPFNTQAMFRGYIRGNGEKKVMIY